MTTITQFVTAMSGLSVSGVTRSFTYKPASVHTADLPALYVELPGSGTGSEFVSTCSGLGKTRSVELVVLLQTINQEQEEPNYDATVTMMDSLETALDTYESTSSMIINYDISAGGREVGGAYFWAATATVTGTDT